MSRLSAIESIVDPAGVLLRAADEALGGLVIFDLFGEVRRSFAAALVAQSGNPGLGTVRGIRSMAEIDCAAMAPLAALLGVALGDLAAGAAGPTPGQQVRRITSALRHALDARRADGPAPWLMLSDPQLLDASSLRILSLLAEGGSLRLLIHVRRAWELPRRLKRLLDNGQFAAVPGTRFGAEHAAEVISNAVGYRVPLIGALALHRMTGGQADQVDLLVQMAPAPALRQALLSGQVAMIPGSEELSHAIRQEHRDIGEELKNLIATTVVHVHIPLHAAYLQWGRKCVETAISGGLMRRFSCGSVPVVMVISPLIAGHLWNGLSAYDLAAVQEFTPAGHACCRAGEPGILLSRGDAGQDTDPAELIHALEVASMEHSMGWATPLAARLQGMLPHLDDLLLRRAATVALARHAYLSKGPHAALRALRANTGDEALWTDPATIRLVVQICMETGRMLPTARRIAVLLGLPAPQYWGSSEVISLLPEDRVSRMLGRGMKAIEAGDMRAAVAHLCHGLRLAAVSNPGPNAAALRVILLNITAISLVAGGYHEGWRRLTAWLGLHRRAWHASSLPAVELARAFGELNDGALLTGLESLVRTSECASLLSAESIDSVAIGVYQGLTDPAAVKALNGGAGYYLGGSRNHGRKSIEECNRAALLRSPEKVGILMQEASKYRDPRAVIIRRCAEAELGRADPVTVAREALSAGQGFQAAWVIDGALCKMLLADPAQLSWLIKLAAASGDELIGVVGELLTSLGSTSIPGVDATLAALLTRLPAQSFPVLPFLAHEAALRALTPREAEIAALARAGMSNKSIAQQLTISIRTVEGHIAAVMSKRGLVARDELLSAH